MDREFESISASLKVTFFRTFRRVSVPVCLPAILDISTFFFVMSAKRGTTRSVNSESFLTERAFCRYGHCPAGNGRRRSGPGRERRLIS